VLVAISVFGSERHVGRAEKIAVFQKQFLSGATWRESGGQIGTQQGTRARGEHFLTAPPGAIALPPELLLVRRFFKPQTGVKLQMTDEFLQSQASLLDNSFQCAGFEWFVLRHDNRPRPVPQNEMRACLPQLYKSTPF
jgi:hypothetical protein